MLEARRLASVTFRRRHAVSRARRRARWGWVPSAVALAMTLLAVAAVPAGAHTRRTARVVGTVGSCGPIGTALLPAMTISAVNAMHQVVKTEAIRGDQFLFRLIPGRYTLMLRLLDGRRIGSRRVTVVAHRTKTVNLCG